VGLSIPVRVAKAKLSALLELVAGDRKSRSPRTASRKRCCRRSATPGAENFHRHLGTIEKMPMQTEGPFADEIIRADRDGRGW